MEAPNNSKPDEKAPKTKYFKPASVENSDVRFNEAIMYKQKLCNSTEIVSNKSHHNELSIKKGHFFFNQAVAMKRFLQIDYKLRL